MNQQSNQESPLDKALEAIRSGTSKTAGIIIANLESLYPKDEILKVARINILSALGDRGLKRDLTSAVISCFVESEGVKNDKR